MNLSAQNPKVVAHLRQFLENPSGTITCRDYDGNFHAGCEVTDCVEGVDEEIGNILLIEFTDEGQKICLESRQIQVVA